MNLNTNQNAKIMRVKFNTFEEAKKFCTATCSIESEIDVTHDRYTVDGKSIMGVLSLDLSHEFVIKVYEIVDGDFDKLKDTLQLMGIVIEDK